VPTVPAKVQPATFTTPETALSPEHEANAPPETFSVIGVEALVTTLPAESSTFTTGSVERTAPETPEIGWVVKTSLMGAPTITLKLLLVTEVRPLDAALRV
jgi:hypothetical protein